MWRWLLRKWYGADTIPWLSPGHNICYFSIGYDPNKFEKGWKELR